MTAMSDQKKYISRWTTYWIETDLADNGTYHLHNICSVWTDVLLFYCVDMSMANAFQVKMTTKKKVFV